MTINRCTTCGIELPLQARFCGKGGQMQNIPVSSREKKQSDNPQLPEQTQMSQAANRTPYTDAGVGVQDPSQPKEGEASATVWGSPPPITPLTSEPVTHP